MKYDRMKKGILCTLMVSVMTAGFGGCGTENGKATERAPIDPEKAAKSILEEAGKTVEDTTRDTSETTEKTADYTTTEAVNESGQAAELQEIEHYSAKLESENHLLSIDVDAPVLVPKSDSFPILSVKRASIDNELLKKVKEVLLGDTQLFDGVRLYDQPIIEKTIESGGDPDPAWKTGGQVALSEIGKYPIDTVLFNTSEKKKDYQDVDSYADYYLQLMPNDWLFYGVTDGKDGSFVSLAATNSDRYGSSVRFTRNKDYLVRNGGVLPDLGFYSWSTELGKDYIFDESRNPTPPVGKPDKINLITLDNGEVMGEGNGEKDPDFTGFSVTESDKETNTITKEEALKQAEDLLKQLGIMDEFAPTVVEDVYYTEPGQIEEPRVEGKKYGYNFLTGRAWHIVYQRTINGNVLEDYGEKYSYNRHSGQKKVWFNESAEVYVNDNGIVGFVLRDPLIVSETVVANSKLLDFAEIHKLYEAGQLQALNSSTAFDSILSMTEEEAKLSEIGPYTFKIDEISLRYVRIAEQDNFDHGLLVPVWSFEGTCLDGKGNVYAEGSFLQINAVDGSIYNPELGY